jgi:broad specificity phosphatase PhoE
MAAMKALLTLLLMLAAGLAVAQPDLIVLVRHAERAAEPAADPGLTPAGEQRAHALALALGGAQVSAIVTTQFKRTRDTAAPLAQALKLQPQVIAVERGEGEAHIQAVARAVSALTGTVLVVGHSNTVPGILAALGGPRLDTLCETSFHHVFLLRPGAQPAFLQLAYGEASPPPLPNCQ